MSGGDDQRYLSIALGLIIGPTGSFNCRHRRALDGAVMLSSWLGMCDPIRA